MKYLILCLLLVNQIASANCDMRSTSKLINERKIGPVTDLEKTVTYGKCVVKFQINVDGEWHTAEGEHKGWEQDAALCYYAIDRAKRYLMLSLGGRFQNEAVTVCTNGKINR